MADTTRPASTETIKNFMNVIKKIMATKKIEWEVDLCKRMGVRSVEVVIPGFYITLGEAGQPWNGLKLNVGYNLRSMS